MSSEQGLHGTATEQRGAPSFLSLPLETRQDIYRHVISPPLIIKMKTAGVKIIYRIAALQPYHKEHCPIDLKTTYRNIQNVSRLCKQIHLEVRETLFDQCVFFLDDDGSDDLLDPKMFRSFNVKDIRKLRLTFRPGRFGWFMVGQPNMYHPNHQRYLEPVKEQKEDAFWSLMLSGLKQLDLIFWEPSGMYKDRPFSDQFVIGVERSGGFRLYKLGRTFQAVGRLVSAETVVKFHYCTLSTHASSAKEMVERYFPEGYTICPFSENCEIGWDCPVATDQSKGMMTSE